MSGRVGEVIVMGGAVNVPGNVTPHAEFNVHTDPEAAKIIFQSDLPVTLVPLDVTMKTLVTSDDVEEIRGRGDRFAESLFMVFLLLLA